jgi:hypothetical protein
MPVAPAPPIFGQQTWTPYDVSGIGYDWNKLFTMPGSLYETDGYRERLDENGWEVTRTYQCKWSDVADTFQWLYGFSFLQGQQQANQRILTAGGAFPAPPPAQPQGLPIGGGKLINNIGQQTAITRVIPAQDPYRPYLYCSHVELVEGQGAWVQDPGLVLQDINNNLLNQQGIAFQPGQGQLLQLVPLPGMVYAEQFPEAGQGALPELVGQAFQDGMAKVRATFRERPYSVANDQQTFVQNQGEIFRYVERDIQYAIQGLPLNNVANSGNQLKFFGGPFNGNLVPEAGVMILPAATYHYTWHEVPFYPTVAIQNCMGRVNEFTFDGVQGWPALAPQTLLCQSPEIKKYRTCCGQWAFRVKWVLDYKPQGWNNFPAGDGNFYPATFGGGAPDLVAGTNLVFKVADFGQLFQVAGPSPWG